MSEVLRLENVSRRYKEGEGQLEVFSDLNMSLQAGEIVALVGQSGAGKSSLLHMAGLLEAPSGGEIYIDGAAASRLPEQRTHPHPPRHDRLRLSGASPAAGIRRPGECGAAADDRGQEPRRGGARKRSGC